MAIQVPMRARPCSIRDRNVRLGSLAVLALAAAVGDPDLAHGEAGQSPSFCTPSADVQGIVQHGFPTNAPAIPFRPPFFAQGPRPIGDLQLRLIRRDTGAVIPLQIEPDSWPWAGTWYLLVPLGPLAPGEHVLSYRDFCGGGSPGGADGSQRIEIRFPVTAAAPLPSGAGTIAGGVTHKERSQGCPNVVGLRHEATLQLPAEARPFAGLVRVTAAIDANIASPLVLEPDLSARLFIHASCDAEYQAFSRPPGVHGLTVAVKIPGVAGDPARLCHSVEFSCTDEDRRRTFCVPGTGVATPLPLGSTPAGTTTAGACAIPDGGVPVAPPPPATDAGPDTSPSDTAPDSGPADAGANTPLDTAPRLDAPADAAVTTDVRPADNLPPNANGGGCQLGGGGSATGNLLMLLVLVSLSLLVWRSRRLTR